MTPSLRRIAIVGVLGAFALQGAATASPKSSPTCQLIKDPTGDTNAPVPDASDSRLDITSADVAVGRDRVVVVVRVASLPAPDPSSSTGQSYEFDFTAKERNFIFSGSLLTGGSSFGVYISDSRLEEGKSGGRAATGIGSASGNVDPSRKEIRMVALRSVFDPYAKLTDGTNMYYLAAFTYRANGAATPAGEGAPPAGVAGSVGVGVDEAWGRSASYRAGRPSCLRA